MRADRLLSIVLLLQSHGQLTAGELARRLEVSKRTILRDMDALSVAGIPVFAERGTGGGWSLLGDYRTSLTGLSEAEIQSLFVTKPNRLLADLNMEKASEQALLKLLAALPSIYRDNAEYARQRIYIDVTSWHRADEAVPLLHALQDAVWQGRKARMVYERSQCEAVERLVDPLGLVAKGSVWYFVAGVEGEVRTYRVSRVLSLEMTEQPAQRPQGFDLATFWEQSAAQYRAHLPAYRMVARVREEIVVRLPYAGRFARIESRGRPDADGWVEVALRFDAEEMACEYALGFADKLIVLDPPELRQQVAEAAARVLEQYKKR